MGFDGTTFVLQLINFAVLAVGLWYFLWRPLSRHVRQRQGHIAQQLKGLAEDRRALDERAEVLEQRLEAADSAMRRALERAEQEAETRTASMMAQARLQAAQERDRIVARAQEEAEVLHRQAIRDLRGAIVKVAQAVVVGLVDEDSLHEAICRQLATELPRVARDNGEGVWIVSARPTVPEELNRVIEHLAGTAEVHWETRPELVAGAQVVVGTHRWDRSLRAELDRLSEGLP